MVEPTSLDTTLATNLERQAEMYAKMEDYRHASQLLKAADDASTQSDKRQGDATGQLKNM